MTRRRYVRNANILHNSVRAEEILLASLGTCPFTLAMMVHVAGLPQINPNVPMSLSSPPSVPVCRSWVAYNMSESALAVVSLRLPFFNISWICGSCSATYSWKVVIFLGGVCLRGAHPRRYTRHRPFLHRLPNMACLLYTSDAADE